MPKLTRGTFAAVVISAVLVGLIGSGALVWTASQAVFSATTSNSSNSWTAGTVTFDANNPTTTLFAEGPLQPGQSGSKCIVVTYTGNLAAEVRLYGAVSAGSPDLSSYLSLTVQIDTEGAASTCTNFNANAPAATTCFDTGTIAAFAAAHTNWSTGCGTWLPSGSGQTRVYRFSWLVASNIPNTHQGASVTASFTWEAQNT
jgi:hypothetical protein